MAKVTLTDLTSLANDTSATNSINENFQTLEDYINDNVLSRDTGAETNTMQNDIDMNSYDLLNVTEINGYSVSTIISSLLAQVGYAEEWAIKPEDTLVSTVAGGNGVDEYSAYHWAQKASDSAGVASLNATSSSDSASAASSSASEAASTLDAFQDIYLGSKASDPALDNDGDALAAGALYFNTTLDIMKAYNGSSWETAYVPTSGFLETGDIGTTVQAYDADTAKTDVEQTYTAAQVGSTQTTSVTGSTTLDLATYNNFVLTLTGNITLANPTTENVGQSGFICFIQDGTGSRTVTLGTDYETVGGAGITLTTTAGATDVVGYVVVASNRILLGSALLDFS